MEKSSLRKDKRVFSLLLGGFIIVLAFAALHFQSCSQVQAFVCPAKESKLLSTEKALAPRYYEYSLEALAQAQRSGKVVLYFWAPWCSTCTSLDLEIQDGKANIPEDVTVLRIDYDRAQELKRRYNVVTQHTFVQIDPEGKPLATWVGGELENFAQNLR